MVLDNNYFHVCYEELKCLIFTLEFIKVEIDFVTFPFLTILRIRSIEEDCNEIISQIPIFVIDYSDNIIRVKEFVTRKI